LRLDVFVVNGDCMTGKILLRPRESGATRFPGEFFRRFKFPIRGIFSWSRSGTWSAEENHIHSSTQCRFAETPMAVEFQPQMQRKLKEHVSASSGFRSPVATAAATGLVQSGQRKRRT
jgi:hypothetical protein